jgi:BMFP domain-containing protein YqiC
MKKKSIEKHKLIILSLMLQGLCNEFERDNNLSKEFKAIVDKVNELGDLSKGLLEILNDIEGVTSTTYIQDIMNKIDTVFRKNFEIMQ